MTLLQFFTLTVAGLVATALGHIDAGAPASGSVESLTASIHSDDECLGSADGSGASACAVNALQFRTQSSSQAPEEDAEASGAADVEGTKSVAEAASSAADVEESQAPEEDGEASGVADVEETKSAADAEEASSAADVEETSVAPPREVKEVYTWEQLKNVVEASDAGEDIHIPQGITVTFKGTININKGTDFNIFSEGATLDGKNAYGQVRMFYVRGNLTMSGFILKNGKTDYAGAAYFDFGSYGDLANCSFRHNEASYMGGAIVTKGAYIRLTNVDFHSNAAQNTCKSAIHCSRRRRNGRRANAMYVLSHTKLEASLRTQPKTQDIFFDKDFDGQALFHCARPRMEATDHRVASRHVRMSKSCNLTGMSFD